MCNGDKSNLKFIFKELYRPKKYCVNFSNSEDKELLGRALKLANENCVRLDGCCTSRVLIDLQKLENVVNYACTDENDQQLKDYLVCPSKDCCDQPA